MLSNFHLAASLPEGQLVEYSTIEVNKKNSLLKRKLDIREGYFYHNNKPGLGWNLDENKLKKII